jgi:hypothetical protein
VLGIPVCMVCKRFYEHLSDEQFITMRKKYPDIGRWCCLRCEKYDSDINSGELQSDILDILRSRRDQEDPWKKIK